MDDSFIHIQQLTGYMYQSMTQQEFAQILPCYFGQKILTGEGTIGTMNAIFQMNDGSAEIICYDLVKSDYKIWEFKLILRKMEDMTDEEYIQFIRVVSPLYEHHPHQYFYKQFRETGHISLSQQGIKRSVRQINYLRSIGIDCDGLIEAGYAVHQKGVKQ